MTSTIKVNKHQNACGTNIIQRCGTTTTIGSGASNTLVMDGSTVTIGRCGGTVALASGATQTGFGRSGSVDWETTIKTTNFTAANGEGYFVNTTSGAVTVTLPSSPSAGDIVAVSDYANTAGSNNITLGRNGSNIEGSAADLVISNSGLAMTVVYADSTKGWKVVSAGEAADKTPAPEFVVATGGSITESGNFKIHTFTGPGTFTVTCAGNSAGSNTVSYMVVAGGGGGGGNDGGGGAGGGYRESRAANDSYTASPLNATSGPTYNLTVTAQGYPVVVGAGGTQGAATTDGGAGGVSSVLGISSAGGAGGKAESGQPNVGNNGGSGSGAGAGGGATGSGGTGNTPPVSPPQGNNGGSSFNPAGPGATPGCRSGGGGGGAGGTGGNADGGGGDGGGGTTSSINGSPTERSSGAGGGARGPAGGGGNPGGSGAGAGATSGTAGSGTANTGGGGGGAGEHPGATPGSGGSGVVIVRYKFQ